MNARAIRPFEKDYPERLVHRLGVGAPSPLYIVGDSIGLSAIDVALLCSVSCPGTVIIKTFDAIRQVRDAGIVVAGGFHSPMERDCLRFLLRGRQRVILSLAHGFESLSLDREEEEALNHGRLIVVSLFEADVLRPTPHTAARRNELVAAIADILFVPHAVPGGKVESEARQVIARGQAVLIFDDAENSHLVAQGAIPVAANGVVEGIAAHSARAQASMNVGRANLT